jgi:hypothetical protein
MARRRLLFHLHGYYHEFDLVVQGGLSYEPERADSSDPRACHT